MVGDRANGRMAQYWDTRAIRDKVDMKRPVFKTVWARVSSTPMRPRPENPYCGAEFGIFAAPALCFATFALQRGKRLIVALSRQKTGSSSPVELCAQRRRVRWQVIF